MMRVLYVDDDHTNSLLFVEFCRLARGVEVKTAHTVTGPFDIIILVEAKNLHELGEVILSKIRGTEGVSRTMTCVTVEAG